MPHLPPLVKAPRHWLIGPSYHARRAPLEWIPKWIEQHGDIFRLRSPIGQATFIASPQLAHEVLVERYSRYQKKSRAYSVLRILMGNGLVTSEGEFWREQRKLVQPAFHRRRLEGLFGMMAERVENCVRELMPAARAGHVIDFAPVLSRLTLDVISRAMFSSDVQNAASEVSRHIALLNEYALRMLRHPWLFLLPRNIPLPFKYAPLDSLKSLNEIVRGIIQRRRAEPGRHDDLLSMLLSACDEETGRGMSDEQLRDEVMTIFVAGHETTANAMCWLMYLVAGHPEVEQRLTGEIDARLAAGPLDSRSAAGFTYVRQVIEESLRVYPTIWSVGRGCNEADQLGGFEIPKGMNIVIPIFHFHWSDRFWSEPKRFDPDRFAPERRAEIDSRIYFPFGAGPRSCIGNYFALQELTILTIQFFRHFSFRAEPGFEATPDPLITLRPKNGMRLMARSRD